MKSQKTSILYHGLYSTFFALLFFTSCQSKEATQAKTAIANPNSASIKLINGNWFNGNSFDNTTAWVNNGILSFTVENTENDTIIDLNGKYVIPPFAEAHNHNLESNYKLDKRINSYINSGVFYVKHLSSIKKRIAPLMHHYNRPSGIDVSLAHAPLTATGGHPVALRKRFLEFGRFDGLFSTLEEIESHGYFIIDTAEDLETKWSQILTFEPDFIKIMPLFRLSYSSEKSS
ncbi:MAG: hypothetical protein AAFP70_18785, partial [Calditrichota bacterium]